MANIKSQIKRNRQNLERRMRNKSARSTLKTQVKSYQQALDSGDSDAARDAYARVAQAYDKAAAKGIVHKNKAANAKSRLAKHLQASP
ncbi:MAG: 30S ribosomal protein S20 [Actinobacteria bacterium]|nr:30S ribosomal protein S20 [Actinomycetota bacterium]